MHGRIIQCLLYRQCTLWGTRVTILSQLQIVPTPHITQSRLRNIRFEINPAAAMGVSRDTFHWADYLILAAVLVASLFIGLIPAFIGGKQRTQSEYLMANRSMRIVPVAMSILMSFTSAIMILGTTAEIYINGLAYMVYAVGMVLGGLLATILFVPLLYPLKLTSSYEV